jgi:hypothetical protein
MILIFRGTSELSLKMDASVALSSVPFIISIHDSSFALALGLPQRGPRKGPFNPHEYSFLLS